jgi:hypothetical protein
MARRSGAHSVRLRIAFCDVAFFFSDAYMFNEAPSRMITWALLEWMSGGTLSSRSTTTSFDHFPLRTLMIHFEITIN